MLELPVQYWHLPEGCKDCLQASGLLPMSHGFNGDLSHQPQCSPAALQLVLCDKQPLLLLSFDSNHLAA